MLCASYKSLLLCTVQLVVQSVLSVLDAAAQAVATAIHDAAQALHDLLNTAAEAGVGLADIAVDGLDAMLGLSLKPPTWHEPMALQYVSLLTQGPTQRLDSPLAHRPIPRDPQQAPDSEHVAPRCRRRAGCRPRRRAAARGTK